ncbi:MAG: DNA-binding response regulator [Acidobacteria bacterium]|nr:MAG: DNA-binding response regulator [Acidobacteriota bacterium]
MDQARQKVLIVEDEEDLLRGLAINLGREGYLVLKAATAGEALGRALEDRPDLILLDVMLPGMNGFDLCRELRRKGVLVPIIMLTAKGDVIDRVVGLEAGADDYVTKPFSLPELLARIRARLRRVASPAPMDSAIHRFGRIELDFERLLATRDGERLHLTSKEFEVLHMLIRLRDQTVSRARMLGEIWNYDPDVSTRTVDTHIRTLRLKLEEDPANPRHILTVYGEGYRFVP